MIMKGNKSNAIDLLKANYEAVKEQMNAGTKGIEEAALLDVIALGYMAVGDSKSKRNHLWSRVFFGPRVELGGSDDVDDDAVAADMELTKVVESLKDNQQRTISGFCACAYGKYIFDFEEV
uniref:Uncharacterized protein n=1 Tax=Quercus lobata TaxID=97700 RepID=A0A7N2MFF5_QUELO